MASAMATESQIFDALRAVGATGKVPRVVASGNASVPWELLGMADAALPSWRLNMLNAPAGVPSREGIVHETSFVGPGMRSSSTLSYVPARLSLVPRLFHRTLPPDIVLVHTSAPIDGKVSLGVEVNILPAAIEACRARGGLIFAQANPNMPYTFGDGEFTTGVFDAILPVDVPIATTSGPPSPPTGAFAHIGKLCAARVSSGATLQLGIGAVPDATLPGLTRLSRLGVWTEMFSDGLLALDGHGALDPDRAVVGSFAAGSEELLRWCHRNERLRMLRTETVNNPTNVARQPRMTSINTALEVDLFAQANASRRNARIHSGFGGQTDFIVGALHSHGGQAILALRSWHPKADVSTIVPLVDEPVTSFQPSAIVTEQGVAEIAGFDEKAQAQAIIEHGAHPSVRAELWEEAGYLGLA
ncbi:MAG: acetyl-CoA hydrolase/transferase C-terminal domain-containing protein [Nostocoides sp.]